MQQQIFSSPTPHSKQKANQKSQEQGGEISKEKLLSETSGHSCMLSLSVWFSCLFLFVLNNKTP